jgi:site-specific DNA-methyltransferase (adenine-specific)
LTKRAPRNRTIVCDADEIVGLQSNFLQLSQQTGLGDLENRIVNQDLFQSLPYLPDDFVDLLILDPPYNLTKNYNGLLFSKKQQVEYQTWFHDLIQVLRPTLKSTATVYTCADWKTSILIAPILENCFHIQNRITWEREKGRGSNSNWKNNTEDIWFCTCSRNYVFNATAVQLKRKVLAPYRDANGHPKDWNQEETGNFRMTGPSNIWGDITIPFWSMPENTDHPTQKPEKLIAKLILASSHPDSMVFDPFLGSGTTAVVSKKLGRRFLGIEQDAEYCCWAAKRLKLAETNPAIQGYGDGVFWERNTSPPPLKPSVHPSQD